MSARVWITMKGAVAVFLHSSLFCKLKLHVYMHLWNGVKSSVRVSQLFVNTTDTDLPTLSVCHTSVTNTIMLKDLLQIIEKSILSYPSFKQMSRMFVAPVLARRIFGNILCPSSMRFSRTMQKPCVGDSHFVHELWTLASGVCCLRLSSRSALFTYVDLFKLAPSITFAN